MQGKKRVLGRGLSALLGEGASPEAHPRDRFFQCPITDISPNQMQPRKRFDEATLNELKDSIREKGVLEPLLVRRNAAGFELIAGERRWRAARLAGLAEVPVVVVDATDEESLEYAIIENIQREDLNAIEEAEAYRTLVNFGLSQEDVAKRVGKERATVANYLRLLKLPPEVKDEIAKGTISMGHARALLSVDGHSAQTELCRRIITQGLSVREAEHLATIGLGKGRRTRRKTEDPSQKILEDELRAIFGTKTAVRDRNGKGRIEIFYFSAEERERVLDLLRSIS